MDDLPRRLTIGGERGRGEGKCVGGGKGNKGGRGVRKGKLKGKNDSGKGYCSRKDAGQSDPWH